MKSPQMYREIDQKKVNVLVEAMRTIPYFVFEEAMEEYDNPELAFVAFRESTNYHLKNALREAKELDTKS